MGPNVRDWEKVMMFRCVQDPMIGPKPRNAFMIPDLPGWEAWFHIQSGAVHVKTDKGRRHLVPTGNLASIELFKEEPIGEIKDQAGAGAEATEEKRRGPGRPRLQPTESL